MAESDDDIGDVVDAIDRLTTVEKLGNAVQGLGVLSQVLHATQAAKSREQAQQAEAARAEQIYLGAHCPCCHTSLTGTPAVCAACTRDIAWLRLPLDAAVFKLISSNLHTFKEVYRDLLGASVVFDRNQKLVHVPLSSQGEVGEAQKKFRPLDEKLTNYINYYCHVVERRGSVVTKCPKCETEVFERALVQSTKGTDRTCPSCDYRPAFLPNLFRVRGFLIRFVCFLVVVLVLSILTSRDVAIMSSLLAFAAFLFIEFAVDSQGRQRIKDAFEIQLAELKAAAEIPGNCLSFGAKTMNGLVNLIDLRTKSLEELLKRIDGTALPKRIASESGDAGSEFANQFEPVAQDSASPILLPSQTPLRHIAGSRVALAAAEAEFTAIEKQKPLTADSPMIRAVALAMVAMKTVDVATVRACTDRLARKLIEITPEALLKSVQIVGREVQEAKLRYAFEQVCDSLRAEPEFAKARHRVVAEVIAELLPKDTDETAKNANGPKVIHALCKVLNS